MNKKIFGKATALSLAAIAALSSFAMTASADIVQNASDMTVTGSVEFVTANMTYMTEKYTVSYNVNAETGKLENFKFIQETGNSLQVVAPTAALPLDKIGNTVTLSTVDKKYFSSTKAVNSAVAVVKNAETFLNTIGPNGATTISDWKNSWNKFVTGYNNAYSMGYKTTAGVEYPGYNAAYSAALAVAGTTPAAAAAAANTAGQAAMNAYKTDNPVPTTTTESRYTYTLNTTSTNITMAALKDRFSPIPGSTTPVTIDVDNVTGEVTKTGPWTINVTGNSGSNSGSNNNNNNTNTSSKNTWYPELSAYRNPTTSGLSYQGYNGYWYTSQAAAEYYGTGFNGNTKKTNYSSIAGNVYFSAVDGYYYATTALANTTFCYQVASNVYSANFGSYKAADGYFYPTIAAAQNASYAYNRSSVYTTYATTATARYFSMITGKCYETAAAAQAAAPSYASSYVIDLATYTGAVANDFNNIYDPYYYYFMMGNSGNMGTTTIDPDAPAIYGSKKKSGWNKIVSAIKTTAKGKTVKVDMNASTVVPEDVFVAAKSKGVNLQFVLDNGATWTVKAADMKSTDAKNINVEYNTKNIKSTLVSKAKKLNPGAVSTAQISVNGSVDVNAALTVKLSSKRAGCTVKAYIKTNSGSIKLVDKAVVNSNGSVTLDVNKGGDYLLVVID